MSAKASAISAGVPSTAAGSGMPQCALMGWPGQIGQTSPAALSRKIGDCIEKEFGFSSLVIIRSREEIQSAVANNPYLKEPGIDLSRLHVSFLPEVPAPAVLKELAGLTREPDRSRCLGKEIYLHLPNGFAKSSLTNNPMERRLLKGATSRPDVSWRSTGRNSSR